MKEKMAQVSVHGSAVSQWPLPGSSGTIAEEDGQSRVELLECQTTDKTPVESLHAAGESKTVAGTFREKGQSGDTLGGELNCHIVGLTRALKIWR